MNPKIVQKSRNNIILYSSREVSAYFREVSAYFREVREYFRGVSAYFRLETSFQNLETNFEKFGAIMFTRGFTMMLTQVLHLGSRMPPILL